MKRARRGRLLPPGLARRLDRPAAGGRRRGGGLSRAGAGGRCGAAGEPESMGEESGAEPPPAAAGGEPEIGKPLTTGYCRLCHGKFSSRSLRNAFGKVPVMGESSEKQRRVEQVFFSDFQRLLGVPVRQDPALPQFVCKDCHAQFYKCRSVLKTFLQRVNTSPTGRAKAESRCSGGVPSQLDTGEEQCLVDLITSSPQCLHRLVIWSHTHAGNCQSVPNMQTMLSSQYCGIIRAVWGCGAGHAYVMDTDSDCSALLVDNALSAKWNTDKSTEPRLTGNCAGADNCEAVSASRTQQVLALEKACQVFPNKDNTLQTMVLENQTSLCRSSSPMQPNSTGSSPEKHPPPSSMQGQVSRKQSSRSTTEEPMKVETSYLSEGDLLSEDENGEKIHDRSMDESFSLCSHNNVPTESGENKEAKKVEEPREKKKPGPKPGWKNKFKPEREELPNIYKCPYQGCTAVYRGLDGMKKHIKEHHEQVRERPCPHPGCNKVFMIDRYLQRHVKLIHTEERNYICDQCGQTFKQRKHLSVHQMRHSGAKPLQCEICGFQCRQRASLKYHMTKHKAEAELEFACDQCGKRFEKAHNLNVHMSMVHPLTQNHDKVRLSDTEQIISSTCSLEEVSETSKELKSELSMQKEPS